MPLVLCLPQPNKCDPKPDMSQDWPCPDRYSRMLLVHVYQGFPDRVAPLQEHLQYSPAVFDSILPAELKLVEGDGPDLAELAFHDITSQHAVCFGPSWRSAMQALGGQSQARLEPNNLAHHMYTTVGMQVHIHMPVCGCCWAVHVCSYPAATDCMLALPGWAAPAARPKDPQYDAGRRSIQPKPLMGAGHSPAPAVHSMGQPPSSTCWPGAPASSSASSTPPSSVPAWWRM